MNIWLLPGTSPFAGKVRKPLSVNRLRPIERRRGLMQLQKTGLKQYALLPSGILIVEPNPGLLATRAQLLLAADYFVAASNEAVPAAGLQVMDIRVVILSQSLGDATVRTLAQEIRLYYPNAQILIFGAPLTLEEQLYDEAIDHHCRPEQLLDALFRLTRGFAERKRPFVSGSDRNLSVFRDWVGFRCIKHHRRPIPPRRQTYLTCRRAETSQWMKPRLVWSKRASL